MATDPFSSVGIGDAFASASTLPRRRTARRRPRSPSMTEQLDQYIGVPDELTEEQDQTFTDSLIGGSLGALASFGNILDLPGSSIRDMLAGENPLDQWVPGNWTTHENRVTGRDLLTKWGMRENVESGMGGWLDDPGEGVRDLSGFGAEVLLDPLTWTGFGALFPFIKGGVASLKPAGMALRRAGLLDDAADVLKRSKISKYDEDVAAKLDDPSPENIENVFASGIREAREKVTPQMMMDDPLLSQKFGKGLKGKRALRKKIEEKLFSQKQLDEIDVVSKEVSSEIWPMSQSELVEHASAVTGKDMAGRSVDDIAYELKRARLSDDINGLLDSTLGGSIRFGVPFTKMETVFSPLGGKVSHKIDKFDRWIASSPPGVWAGTAFDWAAKGQLGRVGQAVARAATRFTDSRSAEVAEALSEIGKSAQEVRTILHNQAGGRGVLALLGRKGKEIVPPIKKGSKVDPDIYHTGDFIKNEYGVAEIIEQGEKVRFDTDNLDGVWVRQYSKTQNEYVKRHIGWDELIKSKRIKGSPTGWAEDTLEQALMTFMRASKEEGFDAAINNIKVKDFYEINTGNTTFRELLENAGGTSAGTFVPELESAIRNTLDTMTKYESQIRNRLAGKGNDIGLISRDEFFYTPRDITKRMEPIVEEAASGTEKYITRESRLFGKDKLSVSEGVTGAKERLIAQAAREGRDPGVAYLPAYVVERILDDKELGIAFDALRADGKKHSIKRYLEANYGKWLEKGAGGNQRSLALNKRFKLGGVDEPLYEAQLELLEEFVMKYRSHAGAMHGPMYIRDMMLSYQNYFHHLNSIEALHDAGLSAMADSITSIARAGTTEGKVVPLEGVIKGLGHKASQDGQYLNTLKTIDGLLSENTKNILGSPVIDSGALKNLRVSKELADSLLVTKKLVEKGPFRKAFTNFIDRFTASFKGNVTLPFPSFANRNFTSGQFVNITSGEIRTLSDFVLYMKHFWASRKLGANPKSDARLVQEIREMDFVGNQHFEDVDFVGVREAPFLGSITRRDTPLSVIGKDGMWGRKALAENWDEATEHINAHPSMMKEYFGGHKKTLGSVDTAKPPKAKSLRKLHRSMLAQGSNYNQIIEWQNRVPMYLYLKDKGYTASEAAKRVRELQFDYSRLTDIERNVMRRAIPFYAFTRNAAPLFFTTLLERPGGGLAQFMRATRHGATSDVVLPPHVTQQTSIPLGTSEDGTKSFVSRLGMAHEDTLGYFSNIGQGVGPGLTGFAHQVLGRTNPLFKGPAELVTGRSMWQLDQSGRGRPLDKLHPSVSQTFKNVKDLALSPFVDIPEQTERLDPALGSIFGTGLETAIGNTPAARYLSQIRQLTDRRKLPSKEDKWQEKLRKIAVMGGSTMFGPSVTTLSPYQLRSARQQAIGNMVNLEDIPSSQFTKSNIDKMKLVREMQSGRIPGGTPLDQLPERYRNAAIAIAEDKRLNRERRQYGKERKAERFRQLGL